MAEKRNKLLNTNSRLSKVWLSSGTSVLLKLITFVVSFFLTRLIIGTYGSEVNGMINSIAQFLALITLLEGGIGGIARAVLYKPLSKKDNPTINKIIRYLERFFRILALIFVVYVIGIAFIFPTFAKTKDFLFTFTLVLIISISTFCEYFFGLSYTILLAADQKTYINNSIIFFVTIANFIVSVLLIKFGLQIHIVKLVSVLIFVAKPIFLSFYCKRKYKLQRVKLEKNENLMPQKWSGIGVHIAYHLHRNTDVFLVTIFLSLSAVSVYSVYNMIIGGILTFIASLSTGFEAAFGDMYANKEYDNLKERFKNYVLYHQFFCTFLLSSTLILILPFIKIYTANITDANYYQPLFAILFVLAEFFYCLRVPYNDLMVATNSFKKIRWGAYIEAAINIVVSVILINFLGLSGVVIGTLCAMVFRVIHFLVFFKKHTLHLHIGWFIRISLCSVACLFATYGLTRLLTIQPGTSYLTWIFYSIIVCVINISICLVIYPIICRREFNKVKDYVFSRFAKRK